jgi:hypothetical protein
MGLIFRHLSYRRSIYRRSVYRLPPELRCGTPSLAAATGLDMGLYLAFPRFLPTSSPGSQPRARASASSVARSTRVVRL